MANEVEYARGYLTIQKMRYKDKLEFQIDVDPEILHMSTDQAGTAACYRECDLSWTEIQRRAKVFSL